MESYSIPVPTNSMESYEPKIVGTEALFADLAHFPVSAIQLAFTVVVFPCLLLAYCGQAAYLMKNKEHVYDAFYRSIPGYTYFFQFSTINNLKLSM